MRIVLYLVLPVLAAAAVPGSVPPVDALIENGHWKRARVEAEAEYKANPKDARTVYRLARVRRAFGNLDEAVKLAETAVSLDPKYAAAQRELGDLYCSQAEKASVFKQIGLAHKCKSAFEAAVSLDPKDPANVEDLVGYLVQAPGIAGGDKKRAGELAAAIVKVDGARGYLIQAEIAANEKQEPGPFYQKAVEADPGNYTARMALAIYYMSTGHDLAQAERQLRAALESKPDCVRAYRQLAIVLAVQNRLDETASLLARAESAIPDDLSPYFSAGNNMMAHKIDLPRAETYLKKYLAETREPEGESPSLAQAHRSLGLTYEKEGRKIEAIGELQTALRLKPDFEAAKQDLKRMK
jgi:tetratricopeptide (TPR) repeat protein